MADAMTASAVRDARLVSGLPGERLATALLLAGVGLLPLQQWEPASVFDFAVMGSDILFLAAICVRGIVLCTGNAPARLGAFHAWIAVYLLASLLAALVLMESPVFPAALAKWIGVAWLCAIAALACDAASDAATRRHLMLAWLLGTVLASLLAHVAIAGFYLGDGPRTWVAPLLSHYGSLPPGPYPRVMGTFANANMAGLFLLLSVGIGLTAHDRGWLSVNRLRALLLLVPLPLLATGSQAIGAVVLLLAWYWSRSTLASRGWRLVVVASGGLFAIANLALLLINPDAPLEQPSVRMQLWQESWSTWQAHFWRGAGLAEPAAGLTYKAPDGTQQYLTDAHNIVLNLGAQGGVLVVFSFLGVVGWLLMKGWRLPAFSAAWAALLLAVGYLGIGGSFEDARVLWVFMGLFAGFIVGSESRNAQRPTST